MKEKKKKRGHFQLQKYEKSYTYKILILPIVLVSSGCLNEQHLTVSAPDLRNEGYIFLTYPSSSFKT